MFNVATAVAIFGGLSSTGCFQEVYYTGPIDATSGESASQSSSDLSEFGSSASGFGDDLVAALATERAQPERVDIASAQVTSTPVASRSANSNRYDSAPAENLSDGLSQGFLGTAYTPAEQVSLPAGGNSQPSGSIQPFSFEPSQREAAATSNTPANDITGSLPSIESTADAATTPVAPTTSQPLAVPTEASIADVQATARTRRSAFLLGSKWSIAALSRDRGASSDNVSKWFTQARALASFLGTSLTDIPPATSELQTTTVVLVNYLVNDGKRVGRDLVERHGAEHAALFELGVKSNMLLVLYEPRTPLAETLAASMTSARELSGSPLELWRPLFDAIAEGRDAATVRRIVLEVHEAVDASLGAAMEQ